MKAIVYFLSFLALGTCLHADAVKAGSFGFTKEDATECLQKAIDSGASTVVVDNTGSEWLVRPIRLRGDLELVFADGVTVRALPGAFKNQNDCLFEAHDSKNLTIRGEGTARLVMNQNDYRNTSAYKWSEWRHLISLRGCENVKISNLTLESSGGDGIYVGTGKTVKGCQNILLENLLIARQYRQGISVISAENLTIRKCRLIDTAGTPPACGIDFEPNGPENFLVNCVLENCEISGNYSYGVLLVLGHLNARETRPISITVKNCMIRDNNGGVRIDGGINSLKPIVKGNIEFVDCRIQSEKNESIRLNSLSEKGFRLTFRNCVLDNTGNKFAPAGLASKLQDDLGNLDFGNLKIIDDRKRPAIQAFGIGAAGLTTVTGNPTVQIGKAAPESFDIKALIKANAPNPILKNFTTRPFNPREFKAPGSGKIAKTAPLRLRGTNRFVQYLKAGQDAVITFKADKVNTSPLAIPVEVTDANGAPQDSFVIKDGTVNYKLHANSDTVYVFEFRAGSHTVSVSSDTPGHGFPADAPLWLFRCNSELYFYVMPGDTMVRVEIDGEEPLKAALYNASGDKAAGDDKEIQGNKILCAQRPPSAKPEVWKLKLYDVVEDHRVRLGAPLLPLLFTALANGAVPTSEVGTKVEPLL